MTANQMTDLTYRWSISGQALQRFETELEWAETHRPTSNPSWAWVFFAMEEMGETVEALIRGDFDQAATEAAQTAQLMLRAASQAIEDREHHRAGWPFPGHPESSTSRKEGGHFVAGRNIEESQS